MFDSLEFIMGFFPIIVSVYSVVGLFVCVVADQWCDLYDDFDVADGFFLVTAVITWPFSLIAILLKIAVYLLLFLKNIYVSIVKMIIRVWKNG